MTIYTRFGTVVKIESDIDEWGFVDCVTEDGRHRTWMISELKADNGLDEINTSIKHFREYKGYIANRMKLIIKSKDFKKSFDFVLFTKGYKSLNELEFIIKDEVMDKMSDKFSLVNVDIVYKEEI